ncbi:histidine phosphatase family protein [Sphingomonas crocodyli]|uniref:Histidine phosphatase family protein n=1 Tax=Sphingomonas crocodyli TaxID=1979270 RepID=A0A437M079_9SPHN|nr:histidine phosphatase family protein [Sphingomonas crocodyli]RVT91003.1 histidine phosphatase family protein [Sphingomonas crocodyli]
MTDFALYLIRHGAPETPGLLMGRSDGMPTPAGIAACVEQADNLDFETLIASDLARSRLAAEAIGARRNIAPVIDPRWRELDFGDWDGQAASAVPPDALAQFWSDPDANPPPNGEKWSALLTRVGAAIEAIDPSPTLIVTHGGAMRAALSYLCGFDQRQIWSFELGYAALISLRIWPGERRSAQIVGLWP